MSACVVSCGVCGVCAPELGLPSAILRTRFQSSPLNVRPLFRISISVATQVPNRRSSPDLPFFVFFAAGSLSADDDESSLDEEEEVDDQVEPHLKMLRMAEAADEADDTIEEEEDDEVSPLPPSSACVVGPW